MNNDLAPREYISAKEAARLLKVSERQVNYYGHNGQIRIQRAGRRVLYHAGDVARLAAQLQVDIRPQQITRSDVNEELISYVQERRQRDQEFLEEQRKIAEQLGRIEAKLNQPQPKPSGPTWQQLIFAIGILLLIGLVLALVFRLM
jgi:DNA-binding transcriptional MerR regulator